MGTESAERESESKPIADRLAPGVTSDVPSQGLGRLDDGRPALAQFSVDLVLLDLGTRERGEGGPGTDHTDGEVISGQAGRRSGETSLRRQERGVFTEEDGPVEGRVTHGRFDRPGCAGDGTILECLEPVGNPVGAKKAGIFGEDGDRTLGLIEPESTEPRHAGTGFGDDPMDACRWFGRPDPIVGRHDDDFGPVDPVLGTE